MRDHEVPQETYLGDGLYALFDGYAIRLRAPRYATQDHWISLDPEVLEEFLKFVSAVRERNAA